MTFLPIVERELRVASRKRSTAWFRLLAALSGMLIGAGFLVMNAAIGVGSAKFGVALFGTLTWLALAGTLAAGVFFTADALSEEKREGTLGFLFLTDLRGYDVVAGKLLSTSLRGAYALLGLFPVLAVTLLMGGVTGLQFWKTTLALGNALFCSLSAGLFVSSLCRDAQRAMLGTFAVLLLIAVGSLGVDGVVGVARGGGFQPRFSLASPVYVFWSASAWGKIHFGRGLLLSHAVGWGCLGLACLCVRRTWQDQPGRRRAAVQATSSRYFRKAVNAAVSFEKRRRLLEPNPVVWLASREGGHLALPWLLVAFVVIFLIVAQFTAPSIGWMIWAQVSWLFMALIYAGTASHAARFFVEAKKSGLTELMLVTPLGSRDVVLGQWVALRKVFGLPVVLLILLQFAGVLFAQAGPMRMMSGAVGGYTPSFALNASLTFLSVLSVAANLLALVWFGMWMGLSSKNVGMATLKTLLLVQVIPWFAISFASTSIIGLVMVRGLLFNGGRANSFGFTFPLLLTGFSTLLVLAKDAAFFIWARKKLFSSFRAAAAAPSLGSPVRAPLATKPPLLPH